MDIQNQNFVFIGFGAVAQCLFSLLMKDKISPKQIKIIEPKAHQKILQDYIQQGLTYIQVKLDENNYEQILKQNIQTNDLVIDLSVNVNTISIVEWCAHQDVLCINTAINSWHSDENEYCNFDFYKSTINYDHFLMQPLIDYYRFKKCPTIVLEHGANPGLVSHLVKKGLVDMSKYLIDNYKSTKAIESALEQNSYSKLAQALDIKVIHISEKDTQMSKLTKQQDEFLNTWSVIGLYVESICPAELGWGTHESHIPLNGVFNEVGNKQAVVLKRCGKNVWVKSWVPHENILGMVITHGEALTINEYLSIRDDSGNCIYSPTVHYAYCPTHPTILSLHELEERSLKLQSSIRVMNDEISMGQDKLGVLIMGNSNTSWWTGSLLDIATARSIVPNQSATTLQVAGSVLSAIRWMINNRQAGILYPDAMPYESILRDAEYFWGGYHSIPTDWHPKKMRIHPFTEEEKNDWQFSNFLAKG